jgi:hypothetical protein
MKQQNERDTITAEITRLEEQLTGLRTEKDRLLARRANSCDYVPIPELSPVLEGISTAECRLRSLQDKLAHHDKVLAYWRSVEESGTMAASAKQAAEDAEARGDELEARTARLRLRIEAMQFESETAEKQAIDAESVATQSYAAALSIGDEKAGKAALAEIQKAQAAVSAVQSKARSDASIIEALTQEIKSLEQQAAAAREEADTQRKAAHGAQLIGLQAQWDETAETLLAVGRKIAQVADTGGLPTGLSRLRVPVFSPERDYIGENDIREVA